MALWNRPRASGDASRLCTETPPAENPKMVTLSGIAAEGGDVPLHPLQRGDLVHVGVVAFELVRALAAQRGEGEEAEAPQAVVDGDKDDALLGERGARRTLQRA